MKNFPSFFLLFHVSSSFSHFSSFFLNFFFFLIKFLFFSYDLNWFYPQDSCRDWRGTSTWSINFFPGFSLSFSWVSRFFLQFLLCDTFSSCVFEFSFFSFFRFFDPFDTMNSLNFLNFSPNFSIIYKMPTSLLHPNGLRKLFQSNQIQY